MGFRIFDWMKISETFDVPGKTTTFFDICGVTKFKQILY